MVEIGTNAAKVLDKLLRRITRTKRQVASVAQSIQTTRATEDLTRRRKAQLRGRLRRAQWAYHGAEDKAKWVVRDFHYKTAHYLLQRYQTVLLPYTSTHQWRQGKKLASVVKRRAMLLRHGQFAARLVQTATQYPGSHILRGSEAYTSKQCGACGTLNEHLGFPLSPL